jgi:hypothetical protein
MADLSGIVDFKVVLDKTTLQVSLTDTSAYAVGTVITGTIFKVTQPDGLTVQGTNKTVELRFATDGSFQNGLYLFTYTVQATGFTDTTVTKTFFLDYHSVTIELTELADAFTPSIQLLDSTVYDDVEFFDPPVTVWAWNYAIRYVGDTLATGTGTNPLLAMAGEDGLFYDAAYSASLAVTLTYQHSLQPFFSLKETLNTTYAFEVYTPPSLATLRVGLENMKAQIEQGIYCGGCGCGTNYAPFTKAQSLYDLIVAKGHGGEYYGLLAYYDQLQKLFTCSGIIVRNHTNSAIPAYNWEVAKGSSGLDPIAFTVGSGLQYAPIDGDVSYINPDLAGVRIRMIYLQAIGNFLPKGHWTSRPGGGFDFTVDGGRIFHTDEDYTIIL